MQILVDTSIFVRAAESGHVDHPKAVRALLTLRANNNVLCVAPQIHYEFWVVATRPIQQNGLGMTPEVAEQALQAMSSPLFRFLRDERAIYTQWRKVVRRHEVRGKTAHDARLVAAMERHELTHVLTFNVADFMRYASIEVLDPTIIANGQ